MTELYTEEKLILFYYKETDLFETLEIEYALNHNPQARRAYNRLISQFNLLNQGKTSPPSGSVNSILAYSSMVSC